MKKSVITLFSALLMFGAVNIEVQAQTSASKTSMSQTSLGEPIKEMITTNDVVIKDIKTLEDSNPSMVAQVIKTQAFMGPAAEIAAENGSYKLTSADKKALIESFNKVLDSTKPSLVKLGNTQAKVNKAVNDIKTKMAAEINKIVYLQDFYR